MYRRFQLAGSLEKFSEIIKREGCDKKGVDNFQKKAENHQKSAWKWKNLNNIWKKGSVKIA